MAISETHYKLLRELKTAGVLPQGGSILEIGQANWYGDMDPAEVVRDLDEVDPERRARLLSEFGLGNSFAVARLAYEVVLQPTDMDAIDGDPNAPRAMKFDLNTPLKLRQKYDTVFNHGTAEHIFNIANVFKVMHDACKPGGLMIHESPFTGWVDHGFYCLQPTLFWDVAKANGYSFELVAIEHLASKSVLLIESREQILDMRRRDQLPDNAMLFVAMRKGEEGAFKVPMQGVYANAVSQEAVAAWRELR